MIYQYNNLKMKKMNKAMNNIFKKIKNYLKKPQKWN